LLSRNGRLRRIVAGKLSLEWLPEQISGWLKAQYPHDESLRVSHETIYRSLFIQARGVLKKGRSTFYMHFRDKDELLASGIRDLLSSVHPTEPPSSAKPWGKDHRIQPAHRGAH
jgi:IS30 family transposase